MGKKGRWFSAIKRVFTPNSKDKQLNEPEKKSSKEKKKKGLGNSFIPIFREPSSIEKILGEAEREHNLIFRPPTPPEHPKTPPFVPATAPSPRAYTPRAASPRAISIAPSPKVSSPRAASPGIAHQHKELSSRPERTSSSNHDSETKIPTTSFGAASSSIIHRHKEISYKPEPAVRNQHDSATRIQSASPKAAASSFVPHKEMRYRPEPTLRSQHEAATKIQAACRGYMARRSFRALKGLVRLQGVVRSQNVQRQTMNAMKYMQLLVRVQSQIQLRRIQMLENQAHHKGDKELESALARWNNASEAGNPDEWDDSLLTKEEIEARSKRKVEAVVKRERAMSYAYSHQPWKSAPKSAHMDYRTGGFPLWWNWVERQLPTTTNTPENQASRNFQLTPPRPHSEIRPTPWPQSSNKPQPFGHENMDSATPKSSRSSIVMPTKLARTPPSSRTPQANIRYMRGRAGGADSPFSLPFKDDDSLTSCPPFSVPNYMTPTVSAKAKVRANSNPKERIPGTPSSESNRRLSFPLTQGIGSFKWKKGSFFSGKGSGSERIIDKNQSLQSIGNQSVDSTVSLPVGVGRKPFNRFV